MAWKNGKGQINKKLIRMYEGNSRAIPDHLHAVWDAAERTVFKENGVVYRRPVQMHAETLRGHRCVAALRRGR